MTDSRPTASEFLQRPDRLKSLDRTEEHLTTVHNLARALWLLLSVESKDDRYDTDDPRDVQALAELAGAVADHAGAARVAYYLEEEKRRDRNAPA
ncbi:hypothetical protein GJ654_19855 [Rhodoblastus acidophilus]|uniref:Uncharacterized protein n=1 Tax=Rhodoblastus acidophilus TaxID=1074 RepID=A0A6N8DSG2_RHOAC|nr:hypothetical protein [Rhodoblastus acidophilus]MCW2276126.1 nucleoside-diphosphate-sugar epimerase [Rhodoblastus acidophilus]MTV33238.1 hypothetical protein [Rhodoblastus acidophilus]